MLVSHRKQWMTESRLGLGRFPWVRRPTVLPSTSLYLYIFFKAKSQGKLLLIAEIMCQENATAQQMQENFRTRQQRMHRDLGITSVLQYSCESEPHIQPSDKDVTVNSGRTGGESLRWFVRLVPFDKHCTVERCCNLTRLIRLLQTWALKVDVKGEHSALCAVTMTFPVGWRPIPTEHGVSCAP